MRIVKIPAARIIMENVRKLGSLSANLPPKKYPIARDDITIPIRLPHTKTLFPKTGARSLLPIISSAITAAPATKTLNRMLQIDFDKCNFLYRFLI